MSTHDGTLNHDLSEPNSLNIGLSVLISAIFFAGALYSGALIYKGMLASEILRKENVGASAEIAELRVLNSEQLATYVVVDKERNVVQIPIAKAMQKVVASYSMSK